MSGFPKAAIPEQKAVRKALAHWHSSDFTMCCSGGGCGIAIVNASSPHCPFKPKLFHYFCIDNNILWDQYLETFLPLLAWLVKLVTHDHSVGVCTICGHYGYRDRTCRCVLPIDNALQDLTNAMDMVRNLLTDGGKLDCWVHMEVGGVMVCIEVDSQLRWCVPW